MAYVKDSASKDFDSSADTSLLTLPQLSQNSGHSANFDLGNPSIQRRQNMDSDSEPWNNDFVGEGDRRNAEWDKLSSDFTNAGYREGITAGKEGALQEGFDSGFAVTGAPLGREIGRLRGISSAILVFISDNATGFDEGIVSEARQIATRLASVRFSDIVPPDLDAEQHAMEHMQTDGDADDGMNINEDLDAKRRIEGLEDMLASMTTGTSSGKSDRSRMEDVQAIKVQLADLVPRLGLEVNMS